MISSNWEILNKEETMGVKTTASNLSNNWQLYAFVHREKSFSNSHEMFLINFDFLLDVS
jgi:hypothetical protein